MNYRLRDLRYGCLVLFLVASTALVGDVNAQSTCYGLFRDLAPDFPEQIFSAKLPPCSSGTWVQGATHVLLFVNQGQAAVSQVEYNSDRDSDDHYVPIGDTTTLNPGDLYYSAPGYVVEIKPTAESTEDLHLTVARYSILNTKEMNVFFETNPPGPVSEVFRRDDMQEDALFAHDTNSANLIRTANIRADVHQLDEIVDIGTEYDFGICLSLDGFAWVFAQEPKICGTSDDTTLSPVFTTSDTVRLRSFVNTQATVLTIRINDSQNRHN